MERIGKRSNRLYGVRSEKRFHLTELLAVQPPEPLATFLDLNGYLPVGVPMLKRVLGLPGQTVCRNGLRTSVDDIAVGARREIAMDAAGRCLWITASAVIGRALRVWTREK